MQNTPKRQLILGAVIIAAAAAIIYFIIPKKATPNFVTIHPTQNTNNISDSSNGGSSTSNVQITQTAAPASEIVPTKTLLSVPFTSQSPLAQWSDPDQQNACEEASMLMAWHWISGKPFGDATSETAEIKAVNDFEKQNYGGPQDISAVDTMKIFKDYFKYDKISAQYDPTTDDIIAELAKGNLVIAPFNGQKLGNPNYSGAGPLRHMMVIRGYDNNKRQFITNDPGTRKGELYRYSYTTIIAAMRDYPTGNEVPILSDRRAMIIVSK